MALIREAESWQRVCTLSLSPLTHQCDSTPGKLGLAEQAGVLCFLELLSGHEWQAGLLAPSVFLEVGGGPQFRV